MSPLQSEYPYGYSDFYLAERRYEHRYRAGDSNSPRPVFFCLCESTGAKASASVGFLPLARREELPPPLCAVGLPKGGTLILPVAVPCPQGNGGKFRGPTAPRGPFREQRGLSSGHPLLTGKGSICRQSNQIFPFVIVKNMALTGPPFSVMLDVREKVPIIQ